MEMCKNSAYGVTKTNANDQVYEDCDCTLEKKTARKSIPSNIKKLCWKNNISVCVLFGVFIVLLLTANVILVVNTWLLASRDKCLSRSEDLKVAVNNYSVVVLERMHCNLDNITEALVELKEHVHQNSRACTLSRNYTLKVVELNMTNNSSSCPDGLTLSNMAGLRTCQRRSGMGCSSVLYPVNISYSRVFGRIKAYQYGPTNSFQMFRRGNGTIDEPYVDGVSLTYGSPRKHIWTFAADRDKNNSFCPCVRDDISTPEFVGEDYFCDTGEAPDDTLAVNNPLWDGSGCDQTYSCCIYKNPPWFYKQLPYPTSDPIELRVCGDQGASGENIALEQIYLYVIN